MLFKRELLRLLGDCFVLFFEEIVVLGWMVGKYKFLDLFMVLREYLFFMLLDLVVKINILGVDNLNDWWISLFEDEIGCE